MNTETPRSFYLRILLITLLVALLGLAPVPRAVRELMANADRSISIANWQAASQYLAEAGEFFTWRPELILQASRYAYQAGDARAAIEYFERASRVTSLSPDDLFMLGDAYYQAGAVYMAEAIWKHVSVLSEMSQAYQRLSDLYLARKDYASALDCLQRLLARNPSETRLYYQIGTLLAATDPEKALPYLIQTVEVDPSHAQQAKELHDKIRTATLFDQPAYTLLIAGRQLASTGEWELASLAFHRATELQPGYADAWAFLGEARQQLAKRESASQAGTGIAELETAIKLDPGSILANTFMGIYWERQEEYTQAQYYLQRAIFYNPQDPYLFSELGNILSKAGDLPAAESQYEQAIRLAPQEPLFYCLLAEFALDQQIQIRELALPAARQAISLDPNHARALDVM
ncbi:MAG: tetratricopeptide repeat protein, partial [Acidobacteriaceae bacterium]